MSGSGRLDFLDGSLFEFGNTSLQYRCNNRQTQSMVENGLIGEHTDPWVYGKKGYRKKEGSG